MKKKIAKPSHLKLAHRQDPIFNLPDWFSQYIPYWNLWLAGYKNQPNVNALEIGSCEGRSAIFLLDNILTGKGSQLTCVDPFTNGALINVDLDPKEVSSENNFRTFSSNVLKRYKNVKHIQNDSWHALLHLTHEDLFIEDKCFHIIYVDGSHVAKDVLTDMVLAWELLEPNGFMILDDYFWRPTVDAMPHRSPRIAIDSFLECYKYRYTLIDKGHQVCLRKF